MVKEKMDMIKLFLFGLVILFAAGCGDSVVEISQTPPVAVRTAVVKQADFLVTLSQGGTLRGDRQTSIPARMQTTVTNVLVKRGEKITANQLLVELDAGSVQSQFRQAEAVYLNARKQLEKMRALYSSGAISERMMDETAMAHDVAVANFASARQTVEIKASFDGIVTDLYVRPGDEVFPGTPLVEIADVSTLRLLLDVPTAEVGMLEIGQTVRVTSPLNSEQVLVGEVYSMADAANKVTRSFEVECLFKSPTSNFPAGTYVTASIEIDNISDALVVPNDAILFRSGRSIMYVIDADTAIIREVEILSSHDGFSAIVGKVAVDQKVVVLGQKMLTPGARVQEVEL